VPLAFGTGLVAQPAVDRGERLMLFRAFGPLAYRIVAVVSSDLSDLLSSSCPEGRGRKRSPPTSLFPGDDDGSERKRRVSDVLEEDAPRVKQEVDRSARPFTEEESREEMLAFNALTLLSECAERLTLQSAQNTPASTPKIVPQSAAAGEHAFEAMSLMALCS